MTPIDEALRLLGDPEARGELEAAVDEFRRAEHIARAGPAIVVRLAALTRAARLLADAADDAELAAELPPLASIDGSDLAAFAREARQAHRRIEAEMAGPPARWQLLQALASVWTSRGHKLGSGDGGRFHRFAIAVGDVAGCEVSHHSIRQLCAKWTPKECRPHTTDRQIAA